MTLRVILVLRKFGVILLLITAIACGGGNPGNKHSPLSGDVSSGGSFGSMGVDFETRVPKEHGVPADLLAEARAATFQVVGLGCKEAQFGTAFLVADRTLVTNAHVVAGVRAPRIIVRGRKLLARIISFDPATDLAVLMVDEDVSKPLSLAEATPDAVVALLGYDSSGLLIARPARVDQLIMAIGKDIYGEETEGRRVLIIDAWIDAGFSGGPVVDQSGQAVGVVSSRPRGNEPLAYATQAREIFGLLKEDRTGLDRSSQCR